MQYQIVKSTWKDAVSLLRLHRSIASDSNNLAVSKTDSTPSTILTFAKAFLHRNRMHTFIAKDGRKIIGYVTIVTGKFKKVAGNAYIVMGVDETYRGKGIGSDLLKRVEQFALEHNMHRIELEVFESNKGAIRLYERNGFLHEGRRKEAVRTSGGYEDILWMGKIL
jgi:RimJ/RimL family protein N-acetyltransferase